MKHIDTTTVSMRFVLLHEILSLQQRSSVDTVDTTWCSDVSFYLALRLLLWRFKDSIKVAGAWKSLVLHKGLPGIKLGLKDQYSLICTHLFPSFLLLQLANRNYQNKALARTEKQPFGGRLARRDVWWRQRLYFFDALKRLQCKSVWCAFLSLFHRHIIFGFFLC